MSFSDKKLTKQRLLEILDGEFPGGEGGGSKVIIKAGAPDSEDGENGDIYIDSDSGIFYGPKETGNWGEPSLEVVLKSEMGSAAYKNMEVMSNSDYDNLSETDPDTIYFLLEDPA